MEPGAFNESGSEWNHNISQYTTYTEDKSFAWTSTQTSDSGSNCESDYPSKLYENNNDYGNTDDKNSTIA